MEITKFSGVDTTEMDEGTNKLPAVTARGSSAIAARTSHDLCPLQEGPTDVSFPDDGTRMGVNPLVIVYTRADWGAVPPTDTEPLKHPVTNVRFSDTGKNTDTCTEAEDCFNVLQNLQKDHMENMKLSDIQYNFLLSNDGTVYEGRGWEAAAHRSPGDDHLKADCIDIAYIGDWSVHCPPMPMLVSGYNWIIYGQDKNFVVRKPKVFQIVDTVVGEKANDLMMNFMSFR